MDFDSKRKVHEESESFLNDFTKFKALKYAEKARIVKEKAGEKGWIGTQGQFFKKFTFAWTTIFTRFGGEWMFLTVLGVLMAILSFLVESGITICNQARIFLYQESAAHPITQYFAWISLPVCLVLLSVGFSHLVSPQAIGSGIPEMKIIFSGIQLKEYLTFSALIAKVVGLTASLGSGLPLGKEGPFVHIACITAAVLSKFVKGFRGIFENESRTNEMLAAACALGVGSCFAAPVGGVLFSIEVTAVYFAVRNYWRGFFAAVCGAIWFRLLTMWFNRSATVTPLFKTNFNMDFPYDPQELLAFAILGILCGLGGSLYVWLHRKYILFIKRQKINSYLQNNYFLYPAIVSVMVASIMYPPWTGKYMAGGLTTPQQVGALFSNFTWLKENLTLEELSIVQQWQTKDTGVLIGITGYSFFTFFSSIISMTIAMPSGAFIPVFKIGAGVGRFFGEFMHILFPLGLASGGTISKVVPGAYATAGAAAFCGAVTHTVSTSVIVFEMTGQLTYIIPVMIAVLLSNSVASLLGPSIFDSVILIRNLPYLPDLLPSNKAIYEVFVEDFMNRDVKYIFYNINYKQLKELLVQNKKLKSFPLVDSPHSMILLGSVKRSELIQLLDKHVGKNKRQEMFSIRKQKSHEVFRPITPENVKKWVRSRHRFETTPVQDVRENTLSENELNQGKSSSSITVHIKPKRSILKSSNSFSHLQRYSPTFVRSQSPTSYSTVTGGEGRLRLGFEGIFQKSQNVQNTDNEDPEVSSRTWKSVEDGSQSSIKNVQVLTQKVTDLSPEDQKRWEEEQLQLPVDLSVCQIDPSPLQLAEMASLLQVHTLFSMVGVKTAYVTAIGKLVGVVGLPELRHAVEDVNNGNLPAKLDLLKNSPHNDQPENCDSCDGSTKIAIACK